MDVHTDINGYCPYFYDECEYINNRSYVKIWCRKCKRYFEQNAGSHLRGHGCSYCSMYKTEKLGRQILEGITDLIFNKSYPKFLITDKYRKGLEIDCYNEQYKIAFEFDGKQHSQFEPFFHDTEDDFKWQQEKDRDKDELCNNNGVKLIRISYEYNFKYKNKMYNHIYDRLDQCGLLKQLETERNVLIIKTTYL